MPLDQRGTSPLSTWRGSKRSQEVFGSEDDEPFFVVSAVKNNGHAFSAISNCLPNPPVWVVTFHSLDFHMDPRDVMDDVRALNAASVLLPPVSFITKLTEQISTVSLTAFSFL